jgi:hypothetical protein
MEQNGAAKPPQIPEGDLFLMIRINPKTNEFQCVFSDLLSGLALHKLGGEFIQQNFINRMFAAPQIQAAPGIDPTRFASMQHFGKRT